MTAIAKTISVKDTAFGQDMLEVLAERQLEKIAFRELYHVGMCLRQITFCP